MAAAANFNVPDIGGLLTVNVKSYLSSLIKSTGCTEVVFDQGVMQQVESAGCGANFFKNECDIARFHNIDFPYQNIKKGSPGVLVLIHARLDRVKILASQLRGFRQTELAAQPKAHFHIGFVPRRSLTCESLLEEEGLISTDVSFYDVPLHYVPLDSDLFAVHADDSFFTDFFMHGETTAFTPIADALADIQRAFGKIADTFCIGQASVKIFQLSQKLLSRTAHLPKRGEIEMALLIDRSVDMITPCLSQQTYEACLDEYFGINSGTLKMGGDKRPIKLSTSEIFPDARAHYFANVPRLLRAKATELQRLHDEQRTASANVQAMRDFVQNKLRSLRDQQTELGLHVLACEQIMDERKRMYFREHVGFEIAILEGTDSRESVQYIENLINQRFPDYTVPLKLMCLLSTIQKGIASRDYKSLSTQFIQAYGYEHLVTLANLRELGLCTEASGASGALTLVGGGGAKRSAQFLALNKRLNLVPKTNTQTDLANPTHMSYVFCGHYSPLSCRLVEEVMTEGRLSTQEDLKRILECPVHEALSGRLVKGIVPRVILVVFVGGVTFSEIGALRFLGKVKGCRFLILATSVVTGGRLLKHVATVT